MFFETRKRFIKSFSEIKNEKIVKCFSYRNLANDVLFLRGILHVWIILISFPDTNDFVSVGICKCEFKFTCLGCCRFTSI